MQATSIADRLVHVSQLKHNFVGIDSEAMWRNIWLGVLLTTAAALNLPGVPTDFTADDAVLSAIADDVAQKFEMEYLVYLRTGVETPVLKQLSAQLANSHSKKDIFTMEIHELDTRDQFFVCTTCRSTINIIARMFREEDGELNGPNNDVVAKRLMLDVCDRLNIQTEEVCAGLFDSNWPTVEYIIKNTDIDSRSFCSLFMEVSFCNVQNPNYNWTLTIDQSAAPITASKSGIPAKSANDLKILHVTDIHYDPLYAADSLAECDEPMCCQRHKDIAQGTSTAAGFWGDYRNCDASIHMIDNAFAHIKKTHAQLDYIYQTGDVVDHMVWATSVEKNLDVLTQINEKLNTQFPNVPIYPCIGNHEPHPLNLFSPEDAPEDINTKWLYEFLYNLWSKWLPVDTKETILKGGYYTVSPKTGFRIIALNSNDCFTDNWWLYYSGTNKIPQLQWLHDTLLAAEKAKEYVHILTHIPSGDGSCWSVWAREYNSLIERFSNTISAIFNGHSHKDEMNVHYSSAGHAVAMSWNGGSLTTFSFKNPNYRIYQADPKTLQILDHETWIFNLMSANALGDVPDPGWFKEYDFSVEFTEDLSPSGVDKLLNKMADNPDLLRKFWRYKMTSADPKLEEGCSDSCLLSTICRLATSVNNQKTRCNELKAKLLIALEAENENETTTTVTTASTSTTTEDGGDEGEDDGAASIVALRLSYILGLFLLIKYLL